MLFTTKPLRAPAKPNHSRPVPSRPGGARRLRRGPAGAPRGGPSRPGPGALRFTAAENSLGGPGRAVRAGHRAGQRRYRRGQRRAAQVPPGAAQVPPGAEQVPPGTAQGSADLLSGLGK
nr:translation initiation factor IF-2-like [Taeniopygia guttata]